ncbi:hypothetical protein BaRGS_00040415 [Batillaria attramentaria]|uniref:Uncharacterized protein n=1 Tax=Batillaria attramentaria TaxID=370345 RepID=A0ABD0J086_9CAEN
MWDLFVALLGWVWLVWMESVGRQKKDGNKNETSNDGPDTACGQEDNPDSNDPQNCQETFDEQASQSESQPEEIGPQTENQETVPKDTDAPSNGPDAEQTESSIGTPDPGSEDDSMPQASHETDSEHEVEPEVEETLAKGVDMPGDSEDSESGDDAFENTQENSRETSLAELIPEEFQEELSAMSTEINVNEVGDVIQNINEYEGMSEMPQEGEDSMQVAVEMENNNNPAAPTPEQVQTLLELARQININRIKNFIVNINKINVSQAQPNEPLVQVQWDVEQLKADMERQRECNQRMEQTMNTITSRLDALEEDSRRQQEALQAQVEEGRRNLEILEQRYEEDMRREAERVQTFVLRLEERFGDMLEAAVAQMEEGDLEDVVQSLLQDFNIRLLGINCGLSVLMDVPQDQWQEVQRRQAEIQDRLRRLFPERLRQEVTWQEAMPTSGPSFDDVDLRAGETLPVQDTNDLQEESPDAELPSQNEAGISPEDSDLAERVAEAMQRRMRGATGRSINFDPQMATPHLSSCLNPTTSEDSLSELVSGHSTAPEITSVVVTGDNHLLMADKHNMMVKKTSLSNPASVGGVRLQKAPEGEQQAGIDVIDRRGSVLRTIANDISLSDMEDPGFLFASGGHVLVSDWRSDRIFVLDTITGEEAARHVYPELKSPRQVVADAAGNIYVACFYSNSVLVMSTDRRWRRLPLELPEHAGNVSPHGVAVTESHVIVAWKGGPMGSIITIFNMTDLQ